MADEEKKVEEAEAPVTEQTEKVEETQKAEAPAKAEKAEPKGEKAEPKGEKAEPKADKADKKADKASKTPADYTPRLKSDYDERIVKVMTEKFGYKNRLEVPRLEKIVINMGVATRPRTRRRSRPPLRKCSRSRARSR